MKKLTDSMFGNGLSMLCAEFDFRDLRRLPRLAPSFTATALRGIRNELTDENVVKTFERCKDLFSCIGSEFTTVADTIQGESADSLEHLAIALCGVTNSIQSLIDNSADDKEVCLQVSALHLSQVIEAKMNFCHHRADECNKRMASQN